MPRPTLRAALVGLVAVAAAASSWLALSDLDLFWHLASGRWIVEHGALPSADPFSYASRAGWRPPEWLAQVYFHLGERALGFAGVSLATATLVAALAGALVLFARATRGALGPGAALALGLFATAVSYRLQPKPEEFSFVFFALFAAIVAEVERTQARAKLAWLVPLALAWGNLHRGGTLGLAALGVALVAFAARRSTRRLAAPLAFAMALAAAAFTVSPSGMRYLVAGASVSSQAIYRQAIGEWAPPGLAFFTTSNRWYALWLVVFFVDVARRRRLDRETLVAFAMLAVGMRALRFLPFAAIAAFPAVSRTLDDAIGFVSRAVARHVRAGLVEIVLAALALGLVGARWLDHPPSQRRTGVLDWRVPVGAASFAAANPPSGRMWNSFDFGGYLLYRLAPGTKVLIDGRNDQAYPPELFEEVVRAAYEPAVLAASLERHGADWAIVQVPNLADRRYEWLQTNPDWQLVFLDDLAAIYVRKAAVSAAYLEEHGYVEVRPFDLLARAAAGPNAPFRAALEREAARLVVEAPRSIRAHYLLAILAKTAGRDERYARERTIAAQMLAERGLSLQLP